MALQLTAQCHHECNEPDSYMVDYKWYRSGDYKFERPCYSYRNGTVTARATANDGSGIFGELVITISNQFVAVDRYYSDG